MELIFRLTRGEINEATIEMWSDRNNFDVLMFIHSRFLEKKIALITAIPLGIAFVIFGLVTHPELPMFPFFLTIGGLVSFLLITGTPLFVILCGQKKLKEFLDDSDIFLELCGRPSPNRERLAFFLKHILLTVLKIFLMQKKIRT